MVWQFIFKLFKVTLKLKLKVKKINKINNQAKFLFYYNFYTTLELIENKHIIEYTYVLYICMQHTHLLHI